MRGRPVILGDFGGGIDLHRDSSDMPPGVSPDKLNMIPVGDKPTSIVQRPGDAQTLDTGVAGAPSILRYFPKYGKLAFGQSDKLRFFTPGGAVTTTIDFGSPNTSWMNAVHAPTSGGQGPVYANYFGAGGPVARYWDGATAGTVVTAWTASAGTLPAGAIYMLYAGNRMWAANLQGYPGLSDPGSAVVWSELGDPRNWPAANIVQFDPDDGELITAFLFFDQYIFVFKPSKAWVIYDLDTGANRQILRDIGARGQTNNGPNGAVGIPGKGVAFYAGAERGIHIVDGSGRFDRISREVDPVFPAAPQPATWTLAYMDDHLYVAESSALGVNVHDLLDYDFRTKTWWRHRTGGLGGTSQITLMEPVHSSSSSRLFAARWPQFVDELFAGGNTDALGGTLGGYWRTPFLDLGAPRARKRLRSLVARGSGLATISVFADQDAVTPVLTVGGVDLATEPIVPSLGVKDLWQVKVAASGANALTLRQIDLFAGDRAR